VTFRYAPIPTADALREEHAERLFHELTREPDADEAARPRDDETLAVRLEKSGHLRTALVRLLGFARSRAAAEPRHLTHLAPPAPRRERAPARASAPALPDREARPEHFRPFRVSWGRQHGADPRRLVAMLCRRGAIESAAIGNIHVAPTFSIVEIAADVADAFAARAAAPDPRDPRVKIRPAPEAAAPRRPRPKSGKTPRLRT
jgi:ATP-dependent RNA helicase DeaD